jgi:hypothetical protein
MKGMRPLLKIQYMGAGGIAPAVEYLLSKCKALSSNPSANRLAI